MHRFPLCAMALLIATLLSPGCSQPAEISLIQPFAPTGQRILELTTETAYEIDRGGFRHVIATFPRPHDPDGPRDFVLYMEIQTDRLGAAPLPIPGWLKVLFPAQADSPHGARCDAESGEGGLRGFLVQRVGRLAGRTQFTSGFVVKDRNLTARDPRGLFLNVTCEDGTRITGRILPRSSGSEMAALLRRHAADIAALRDNRDDSPTDAIFTADAQAAPTPLRRGM
ncbi:MAG: hypothetical protein IPM64_01550 [Phycisphaerales bacterium]|nr:hypothetical protein [Phycisphaerales bacterium]